MIKLVERVSFFVAVLFFTFASTSLASYQPADGVVTDFPEIISPENDGSSFMAPPFPRSTGPIAKNTIEGGNIALYTTTAPTACSTVKAVKGEVVLTSTDNSPLEIGVTFAGINRATKTIIPGKFLKVPEAAADLGNGVALYYYKAIGESIVFEYQFDTPVPYADALVMLTIDDADEYAGLNSNRTETLMFSDLTLSYVIKNIEFDLIPTPCPGATGGGGSSSGSGGSGGGGGGTTTGYRKKKKEAVKSNCPVFTQYMKQGDRNGGQSLSKQQLGVSATIKEVKLLQQTLKDMGYFTGTPNGVFGPQTKEAVKAYQALKLKNVIAPWQISKPTGWAYQATIRQLNTDLGCYQTVTLDNGVVLK